MGRISPLGTFHVPAGGHSYDSLASFHEHNHNQSAGIRPPECGIMAQFSFSKQRRNSEDLLCLFGLDPVPQFKLQDIPIVPVMQFPAASN
jgi:hypothetical protein